VYVHIIRANTVSESLKKKLTKVLDFKEKTSEGKIVVNSQMTEQINWFIYLHFYIFKHKMWNKITQIPGSIGINNGNYV
jgi:hypothetical protein